MVSIIMSVYNAEKFLALAIESILHQTYTGFEFIIIEDCSTDNTGKILDQYAKNDLRIKVIKKERNKGMQGFIRNLNLGLSVAKGKYIARMDADDIAEPDRLHKQFDFLEKNPQYSLVGTQLTLVNETGHVIGEKLAHIENDQIYRNMVKSIQLFHPSIMFRNDPQIYYREKMLYCEDYDLYLRLISEKKKLANLPDKLLKYRILDQSISRSKNMLVRKMFLEKCFQFHSERQAMGNDSYEEFEVNDFLNVLEPEVKTNVHTLKLGLSVALKYNLRNDYHTLLNKLLKNKEKVELKYKLFGRLPQNCFKYYSFLKLRLS
nr:glycosyltransferase [Chryseobacterium taklimakanense]